MSSYLNDYLLEKLPAAKVAATRGVDWYLKYTLVNYIQTRESRLLILGVDLRLKILQKHFQISLKAFFVTMRYVLTHQVLAQSSKSIMSRIDNKLTGVAYFQPKDHIKLSTHLHSATNSALAIKLSVEPRLFALIIGINDYTKGTKLLGACADALAIGEYLQTALGVPSNQITVLLDHDASRDAIINGLMGLRDNKEIQPGDPILIFYAGHGAEIVEEGTGKVQSIISQDYDGISVHPIPDRTIGSLLAQIHAAKGDNIVSSSLYT